MSLALFMASMVMASIKNGGIGEKEKERKVNKLG